MIIIVAPTKLELHRKIIQKLKDIQCKKVYTTSSECINKCIKAHVSVTTDIEDVKPPMHIVCVNPTVSELRIYYRKVVKKKVGLIFGVVSFSSEHEVRNRLYKNINN